MNRLVLATPRTASHRTLPHRITTQTSPNNILEHQSIYHLSRWNLVKHWITIWLIAGWRSIRSISIHKATDWQKIKFQVTTKLIIEKWKRMKNAMSESTCNFIRLKRKQCAQSKLATIILTNNWHEIKTQTTFNTKLHLSSTGIRVKDINFDMIVFYFSFITFFLWKISVDVRPMLQ